LRDNSIRNCDATVYPDCGAARTSARQRRLIFASAALRTILAAAMFAAAAIASPDSATADPSTLHPAPSRDTTEELFFTFEYIEYPAHATRRQVAAAFRKALAADNVEASTDDFAAAVDEAMRQLADWNGEFPLRGCARRLCWEFVSPEMGMRQSK